MDPGSRRTANCLTDGRSTPQPNTGETDPRIRGGVSRRTVSSHSQKFVTRHSASGGNDFHYEIDPWETTPKTDYTYSRSRSYLRQPVTENYISPNMSRRSLHGGSPQSDEHSAAFNLMSRVMWNSTSSVTEEKSESDMTLRSRTLPQHQSAMTGWQSDNTFQMRNMHGTDLEEDTRSWSTSHSAHGYHGNHVNNGRNRVVSDGETLFSRFSSFLVTVIWTCVSMITYFPKKASMLFSTTEARDHTYQSTQQQHEVIAKMTTNVSETTTATVTSRSKWSKILEAFWSVSSFLVVTLPVGLASWAIYGVITTVKAFQRSCRGVWCWLAEVLHSTVTTFSRVSDAAVVSRTNSLRRRCGCCCLFPLLFLLPLLFIGLLYGYSCQKDLPPISSVKEQFSAYFPFLAIFGKDSSTWIRADEPLAVVAPKETLTDKVESDEGGLLAVAMLEERMRGLFLQFATDHKVEVLGNQEQALAAFQSRLHHLVKLLVQRELEVQRRLWSVQIGSIKSTADGDRIHVLGEQHKQMEAIEAMRAKLDSLAEKSVTLSDDLKILKMKWTQHSEAEKQPTPPVEDRRIVDLENHLKHLDEEFISLKKNYEDLNLQISKWPSEDQILLLIKTRIREYFIQVMSDIDTGAAADVQGHVDKDGRPPVDGRLPFGLWLGWRFVSRDDLDGHLAAFAANITKEVNEKILASKDDPAKVAAAVAAIIDKSTSKVDIEKVKTVEKDVSAGTVDGKSGLSAPCPLCDGTLSEADVLRLIQNELGIYDADKTGKVDYALESAGGSIISDRCSETYQLRTAQTSVFGIPLWYTYNSPRVVIQPGMQPGECWPFVGSRGSVVVQLSRQIFITEVTIEHIPRILSPSGSVDSALKDFEILGLENETDTVGKLLGKFTYTSDGSSIQTFKIKDDSTVPSFKFVELKVSSNHGNEHFTCLYRFRVHGNLDPGSA